MVSRKMSPILSKLLNDVEMDFPAVSDSEIIKANEELTNTMAEAKESSADAEMLSEAISDLEVAKEDIAAGLESGIDHVSAKLLMANLNNCIKRVDSEGVVSLAGLQSDNVSYTLQAGLLAADGIIKKAIEVLKALWKKIVGLFSTIWNKIKQFVAWLVSKLRGGAKEVEKNMENMEAVDKVFDRMKEEDLDEINKNYADNNSNSFSFNNINTDVVKNETPEVVAQAEVIVNECLETKKKVDKKSLDEIKDEVIKELWRENLDEKSSQLLTAVANFTGIALTSDINHKKIYELPGYIMPGENGMAYDKKDRENFNARYEDEKVLVSGAAEKIIAEIISSLVHKSKLPDYFQDKNFRENLESFISDSVCPKLENINSYAEQVEDVIAGTKEFNRSVLDKNKGKAHFLTTEVVVRVPSKKNKLKGVMINIFALVGNGFYGGDSKMFKPLDFDYISQLSGGIDSYSSSREEIMLLANEILQTGSNFKVDKKGLDNAYALQKKAIDALSKLIDPLSKELHSTDDEKKRELFTSLTLTFGNLNLISKSLDLYVKSLALPVVLFDIIARSTDYSNFKKDKINRANAVNKLFG